jgi:hypothetical protein
MSAFLALSGTPVLERPVCGLCMTEGSLLVSRLSQPLRGRPQESNFFILTETKAEFALNLPLF